MSRRQVAKFKNDKGVAQIRIGTREFMCAGESAPQDHPQVYLHMGERDTIVCPYCATVFVYDTRLGPHDADPPDCVFVDDEHY